MKFPGNIRQWELPKDYLPIGETDRRLLIPRVPLLTSAFVGWSE